MPSFVAIKATISQSPYRSKQNFHAHILVKSYVQASSSQVGRQTNKAAH